MDPTDSLNIISIVCECDEGRRSRLQRMTAMQTVASERVGAIKRQLGARNL